LLPGAIAQLEQTRNFVKVIGIEFEQDYQRRLDREVKQ